MTIPQALLAFVAASALLTITPALDTALVLHTALARGARAATATTCDLKGHDQDLFDL